MGYELRRALREALGPDVVGLQRAVALEIADDANDTTRESWASLDDLARWTAAKDANVVRSALKRLAALGWEFRVPMGVGKDGRVLYAVPGRRLTFRVPNFEGVATATPSVTQGVATAPSEGATAPSQGATAPSEGATATPFSSVPSVPSSLTSPGPGNPPTPPAAPNSERETISQHPDAEKVLAAYADAAGRPMLGSPRTKMLADASERLAAGIPLAWLIDRARELPAKSWTDLARHCDRSTVPTVRVAPDGREPWCQQCGDPTYRMIKDPARDNELVECDTCHPAAVARRRRAQAGAAA